LQIATRKVGLFLITSWRNSKLIVSVEPITDDEVAALVERIALSVMRCLKKIGYLDKEGEIVQNPKQDDLFTESESLSLATECSITGKISFGPNAGNIAAAS
jgi:hypothetical protein